MEHTRWHPLYYCNRDIFGVGLFSLPCLLSTGIKMLLKINLSLKQFCHWNIVWVTSTCIHLFTALYWDANVQQIEILKSFVSNWSKHQNIHVVWGWQEHQRKAQQIRVRSEDGTLSTESCSSWMKICVTIESLFPSPPTPSGKTPIVLLITNHLTTKCRYILHYSTNTTLNRHCCMRPRRNHPTSSTLCI